MTDEEQQLAGFIMSKETLPSVSQAIRTALLRTAINLGIQNGPLGTVLDSREGHTPRRRRGKPDLRPAGTRKGKASKPLKRKSRANDVRSRGRKSK